MHAEMNGDSVHEACRVGRMFCNFFCVFFYHIFSSFAAVEHGSGLCWMSAPLSVKRCDAAMLERRPAPKGAQEGLKIRGSRRASAKALMTGWRQGGQKQQQIKKNLLNSSCLKTQVRWMTVQRFEVGKNKNTSQ